MVFAHSPELFLGVVYSVDGFLFAVFVLCKDYAEESVRLAEKASEEQVAARQSEWENIDRLPYCSKSADFCDQSSDSVAITPVAYS